MESNVATLTSTNNLKETESPTIYLGRIVCGTAYPPGALGRKTPISTGWVGGVTVAVSNSVYTMKGGGMVCGLAYPQGAKISKMSVAAKDPPGELTVVESHTNSSCKSCRRPEHWLGRTNSGEKSLTVGDSRVVLWSGRTHSG